MFSRTAHLFVGMSFDHLNQLLLEQKETFNDPDDGYIREHVWIVYIPHSIQRKSDSFSSIFSKMPLRLDSAVYAIHKKGICQKYFELLLSEQNALKRELKFEWQNFSLL